MSEATKVFKVRTDPFCSVASEEFVILKMMPVSIQIGTNPDKDVAFMFNHRWMLLVDFVMK